MSHTRESRDIDTFIPNARSDGLSGIPLKVNQDMDRLVSIIDDIYKTDNTKRAAMYYAAKMHAMYGDNWDKGTKIPASDMKSLSSVGDHIELRVRLIYVAMTQRHIRK